LKAQSIYEFNSYTVKQ